MNTIVVIPSYNECTSLMRILPKIQIPFIVIDDGSTDETASYLKSNHYNCIIKQYNEGVSKAIKTGINYAYENGYENVITLDGDGQHDYRYLDEFLYALQNNDFVYGNRFSELHHIPSTKIASNMFASVITLAVFGIYVLDVSCGFRGFKTCDYIDSFKEVDMYQFIYTALFESLIKHRTLLDVKMEPIYYVDTLLCTRHIEIMSLLNAIAKFKRISIEHFDNFRQHIIQRDNAQININGYTFYFFYLQTQDAYIVQCDLKDASKYYSGETYNV